ncbi:MAG: glycosyltransferase family 39 protein [Clostridium sp.]|nr:glycosyltransferase family 39 protein [Clostridium sp.]
MYLKDLIKKEYKILLVILLLFTINSVLFKFKMIDVYTDFGKELFYSQSIAEGEVLYKDIFVLFGPFSYMLNGFFICIFKNSLNTLYLLGLINCFSIIFSLYFICRNFLSEKFSAAITLFVLYGCCFVPELNNFITPYSYAMTYGLNACFISILLYLSYLKNNSTKLLYFSFLFSGIAATCKYEFLIYVLLISIFTIIQKEKKKNFLTALCFLIFIPSLLFTILFASGLSFPEIFEYFTILFKFSSSSELSKVYAGTFYFSLEYFIILLKSLLVFIISYSLLFFSIWQTEKRSKKTKIFLYIFIILITAAFAFFFKTYFMNFVFCWMPIVLTIVFAVKINKIKQNKMLLFLTLSSLLISLKSYFFLAMNLYGRYFLPLLITSLIVLLYNSFQKETLKYIFEKSTVLFLSILAVLNFSINLQTLIQKKYKIETNMIKIYADEQDSKIFNYLTNYIEKNTKKENTLVVLPETPFLNYLTGRKSDNYYNYFVPALLKSYDEKNIIKHYEKTSPDYFIIFTSPYDETALCNGYGFAVCGWIKQNYELLQIVQSNILILIFKKI